MAHSIIAGATGNHAKVDTDGRLLVAVEGITLGGDVQVDTDALEAINSNILAKIIAAPATAANQTTLIAKDFATQTTLAAIRTSVEASAGGSAVSVAQTRPDNATAYTAGDVVGQDAAANITFENVLATAAGRFIILGARLRIDVAAIPAGMSSFRLHLYNADPTAITDNLAYNLIAADRAKYLGFITITTPVDVGDTLWAQVSDVNFVGKLAAASTTLYGVLQTVGAYTPTAVTVKTVTLNVAAL